jgi:hypothetical protein
MNATDTMRDERTIAAEGTSYRWGFLVLSFGLLLATMYRSFVAGDASWDLLALVIAGGAVTTAYQATQHVLSRRWAMGAIVAMVAAAVLAAGILLVR